MPKILQDPSANRVVQCSVEEPFTVSLIIMLWTLKNPSICSRKPSIARYTHRFRNFFLGKEYLKGLLVVPTGMYLSAVYSLFVQRFDFNGTTK